MPDNLSYIIEIASDGTIVLTYPDDSTKEIDSLEETFDAIQADQANRLMTDENFLRL